VADSEASFQVVSVPRAQRQIGDWLVEAARRHTMHALLEIDVTDARRQIREVRARIGEPLSFTAFVVACLARAIDEDRLMHAQRKGRRQLVLFDEVDVAVAVEHVVEGTRIPVPHVIRAANRKSPSEITRQISSAVGDDDPYGGLRRLLPAWLLVPGPIRRLLLGLWLVDPGRRKRLTGTTFVSAVGMFGAGTAWGIPMGQNYTVGVTVGSIALKPGVVRDAGGERIEPREFLSLTITFDHDIVDGGPAARFARRLTELLEGAEILDATAGVSSLPAAGPGKPESTASPSAVRR
jgi:pyruvate/2-oxoglutarate dehydrogenase complex dihydrolipoamide acyltransferase (E2) component